MADNNVFTAVDQAGYDYYGDGTDYSDCWTYPKEKIDELVGDSLNGIETAKEEAIAAVQEAGSGAVHEIEEKGEETLESIPDDYTQLSNDVSELKTDFTHLENDKADIIINFASGAVASFNDGANYPVKQTVFTMNPVQDLNGQEYPYPAGGGKNKLQNTATSQTVNGITFAVNTDGTITASGTATASARLELNTVSLQEGSYFASGGITGTCYLNVAGKVNSYGSDASFNVGSGGETLTVSVYVASGTTANGTFKPMIRLSSVTDATFAPYSNICPITGHTEVDAVRTGKNLYDKNNYTSIVGYISSNSIATSSSGRLLVYLPCKPNTAYCVSRDAVLTGERFSIGWTENVPASGVAVYDVKSASITQTVGNKMSLSLTTGTTAKYLAIWAYWDNRTDALHTLQIELGSTASTYEAFNGQSVIYQLGQTVYAGALTINEDGSGQIVSKYAKKNLGDLTWAVIPGNHGFSADLNDYKFDSSVQALCTQYKFEGVVSAAASMQYRSDKSLCLFYTSGNLARKLYVKDSAYTTAQDFKSAMSSSDAQVVYELAEPVIIPLSRQEVLSLIEGQNYIWHDANGDTEVTYRADTKKYIDNKFAELQTLIANL